MAVAACLGAGIAACGVPTAASPTPLPVQTAQAGHVPGGVTLLAARMQRDYASGQLAQLSQHVPGIRTVPALTAQLQRWNEQGVGNLRVSIVHSVQTRPHRYIETLKFSSDPRAIPVYDIVVMDVARGHARLSGSAAGISGTSYARASWSVTRSKHFVVYHSRYQLAGSDRSYLSDLEHQRTAFEREFGVHVAKVTAYYLYPTVQLMDHVTRGACGSTSDNVGCAEPYTSPPSIQAAIWPTYHEPIHVYELAFTPPPKGNLHYVAPLFIGEGMAVALEDREADPRLSDYCSDLQYAPLDACASQALQRVAPLSILSDRGFQRADPSDAYSLGGSFVKYLILQYGYRRFGRFYYRLAAQPSDTIADYNVATRSVYGTGVRHLVNAWTAAVRGENL